MLTGFIKFNKGILRSSMPIKVWLMILAGANLLGPLFFLSRLEAQVVIGTFVLSACLMTVLTARFGFTRLLGLGHVLWIPMLGWLWLRLEHIPAGDPYGNWLRALMILNGLSLMMDVADVIRYLAGNRKELVEDL
ncbi:MAG: hypothetical protein HYV60_13135 [Planctomycetia bacterium]|nr:hypothetical protein [Planctomycetia bacterium]